MTPPWVTIWSFSDLSEALIAKSKLDAAGIAALISNEQMLRMGYINAMGGIALQVDPAEAEEALAVLQEPIPDALRVDSSSPAYMQPRCPQCGSLKVRSQGPSESLTTGSWLSPQFNVHHRAIDWECAKCSHAWSTILEEADAPGSAEVLTRVFVATTNAGKLKDFSAAAEHLGVDVTPFPADRQPPDVEEDGDTFEANAIKKAEVYSARLPNELVIADDSGLEVDALGGRPGVYSARYAATEDDPKPSDSDNNYKLIYELSRLPSASRTARFVCVIAAARNGRVLQTFRGEARGEVLSTPIGGRGFGYDPLFYVQELNKTFAEMNGEEKAKCSHRGAAFRAFLEWLKPEVGKS